MPEAFKSSIACGVQCSRVQCLRRSRLKIQLPAAFNVQGFNACGVQGLKVQCLRRSRFKGSMPEAFKV
jgi:hypothetical protein